VKKQIEQRDKRTGRVYVYETDMEYDPVSKKTCCVTAADRPC